MHVEGSLHSWSSIRVSDVVCIHVLYVLELTENIHICSTAKRHEEKQVAS